MKTYDYKVTPGTNIREAVENAIKIAQGTGTYIFVEMNEARFSVGPNTKIQTAIDTYLEVLNKIQKTKQQLKQKTL